MQRVQVLASGKYKFVKNIRSSSTRTSKTKTKRKTAPKKRGGNVGNNKSLYRSFMKIAKIGSLIAPAVGHYSSMAGNPTEKLARTIAGYGGYNLDAKKFDGGLLINMWLPYIGVNLVEKGIAWGRRFLKGI